MGLQLAGTGLSLFQGDLPETVAQRIAASRTVAWDIETSGLDWKTDRIGTCQLAFDDEVALVRVGAETPRRLGRLLTDERLTKVFHHAMFDLRFMSWHWGMEPRNVACTKIAAKLLRFQQTSLQRLMAECLGQTIDKGLQKSDWTARELSEEQIRYAVGEVTHLVPLLHALEQRLENQGDLGLARNCFAHIPTRVRLELLGYQDVYTY